MSINMIFYSTDLLIENIFVSYNVYKEGSRLFFKPLEADRGIDAPIFWAAKIDNIWQPINIQDQELIKQIQEDILKHEG